MPPKSRQPKDKGLQKEAPEKNRWRILGLVITGLSLALGIPGLWIFWPKISIEPYASTNPRDPFAQFFFVHNESIYPIFKVQTGCGIDDVSGSELGPLSGVTTASAGDSIDRLGPGGKTNIACHVSARSELPFKTLELTPKAFYSLPFGIRECKAQHFTGKVAADGSYIWTYHGDGEC